MYIHDGPLFRLPSVLRVENEKGKIHGKSIGIFGHRECSNNVRNIAKCVERLKSQFGSTQFRKAHSSHDFEQPIVWLR